ncbi:DUF998 domain-containing protein [Nonomuraea sp. NN258]|uniref:DUF998 domain-containing protein n=1 Tax=Nonomuraea antri TaxID=2730852 RepID=UPI001569D108|nr:DUF998 domain-containing protein [Nonomuraea antri]NRQ39862.1 DUF998 domain-containing protein [Nonomuraea antri]
MSDRLRSPSARTLLTCGVVAGPLFVLVVLVQDYTRPGFDPRRHPLSLLSLGDLGWVQIANFMITGVLFAASAAGLRRALAAGPGHTWGPLLIGLYGMGLVGAGVFVSDPAFGYPAGAPAGLPGTTSAHYVLHGVSFGVVLVSLIGACFVFARRFAAQGARGWALYCAATGVALPVCYALAGLYSGNGADPGPLSLWLRAIALLGWLWAAALALRVRTLSEGRGATR